LLKAEPKEYKEMW